ncbi:phosphatidylinositol transfer protein 3-like isoform X3 [Salvia hispanica]|uniref:phosphatidylinositol transfer protein 3-like isoform X3 n=1 Tax=Salvia hispanica TaxID=49212 RepID=UPI002009D5AD|nr:phosphatidylinositol transfer protein 3-like isoform X3 [Salvia hispanica]
MWNLQLMASMSNSSPPEMEQAKINEVRRLIEPQSGKLAIYCSDASISRYLRARNWNVKKAVRMLKATLKWRQDYKPEEIRWDDVAGEAETGKIYKSNYKDRNGRPVLVMRPSCQGFNLSHISIKVTRETAHVLQEHYPERLGVAILYDAPKIFQPFWMVAKPFLEPKTANKVKFVCSDDPNTNKIMSELFDMEMVESAFGGKDDSDFSITKYAERMREDDKRSLAYWKTPSPTTVNSEIEKSDVQEDKNTSVDDTVTGNSSSVALTCSS